VARGAVQQVWCWGILEITFEVSLDFLRGQALPCKQGAKHILQRPCELHKVIIEDRSDDGSGSVLTGSLEAGDADEGYLTIWDIRQSW
jgi:hypothetical protein